MKIVFYEAPMSSASPVACALAELDVPHERVRFDLARGDQKQPAFLKLNPNGKVPTLVVDGTPMFESLAIMQWLGDRFGVARGLWPDRDSPARLLALSWTTWSYVTYGALLTRLIHASSPRVDPAFHSAALAAQTRRELEHLLAILDERLAAGAYLLGESYSLADLIVANVVAFGVMVGVPVDAHAHVKAWLERCRARPAFRAVEGG